jgi:mannosyltransferase
MRSRRRAHLVCLGLVLLLGASLRLFRLDHQSLWFDEARTLQTARMPLGEMLDRFKAGDSHPPLGYLLLYGWTSIFGPSDLAARGFPALFGILILPLIYWVGASLFNRRAGLLSALLASTSVFHVYYSQEVRTYSLLCLLGFASHFLLYKALAENKNRYWLGYGVLITATLYVHYYGFFLAAVGCAFVLIRPGRRRVDLQKFLVVSIWAGLAFTPWLYLILRAVQGSIIRAGDYIPPMSLFQIWQTFDAYTGLSSVRAFGGELDTILVALVTTATLLGLVSGLATLKIRGRTLLPSTANRGGWVFVVCIFGATLALPMLVSVFRPMYLADRFSIVAWPGFILILGLGLSKIEKRSIRIGVLVILLASSAISLYTYYFESVKSYDRQIAATIESRLGPRSIALFVPGDAATAIERYLSKKGSTYRLNELDPPDKYISEIERSLSKPGNRMVLALRPPRNTEPRSLVVRLPALYEELFRAVDKQRIGDWVLHTYTGKVPVPTPPR